MYVHRRIVPYTSTQGNGADELSHTIPDHLQTKKYQEHLHCKNIYVHSKKKGRKNNKIKKKEYIRTYNTKKGKTVVTILIVAYG